LKPVLYLIKCRLKSRKIHNIISFLVVAFCVAVIIIALSISNGFEKALIEKIIVASPQVTLSGDLKELILPEDIQLEESLEIAQVQALAINSENKQVQGVLLRGTLPENIPLLFKKKEVLLQGIYPYEGEVIIGDKLSDVSGLYIGDTVKVLTGPAIFKEFKVSGIFKVGLYDFDSTVMVASFDDIIDLEPMEGEGIASKVSIFKALWLKDPFQASLVSKRILFFNPSIVVSNWQDDNKSLVQAISLEKKVIFIVLLLLVIATSVAIANSQFIQIISQQEQIAILSAIGFTPMKVLITFLIEGFVIGLIGSIAGVAIALVSVYYLGSYPLTLPMDVYQVETIPVKIEMLDIFLTGLASVFMVCLCCCVPAYYASKLDPVDVLRRV